MTDKSKNSSRWCGLREHLCRRKSRFLWDFSSFESLDRYLKEKFSQSSHLVSLSTVLVRTSGTFMSTKSRFISTKSTFYGNPATKVLSKLQKTMKAPYPIDEETLVLEKVTTRKALIIYQDIDYCSVSSHLDWS